MYAGILRDKLTNTFAQGRVTAWTKVKAHQDFENFEGTEWQHARGNYLADKGAAEAQGMHPELDETQVGRLNKELEHAEAVLAVIGALWRHWPKLPRGARTERRAAVALRKRAKMRGPHKWIFRTKLWQRKSCLRSVHSRHAKRFADKSGCDAGRGTMVKVINDSSLGHRLGRFLLEDGGTLFACLKCGAYGIHRARNLRRCCKGKPCRGSQALKRLAAGKHPQPGVKTRVLDLELCRKVG